MKVARARSPAGSLVVKVFATPDQGVLNLKEPKKRILEIKRTLEGCPNCLPFQRVQVRSHNGAERSYLSQSSSPTVLAFW